MFGGDIFHQHETLRVYLKTIRMIVFFLDLLILMYNYLGITGASLCVSVQAETNTTRAHVGSAD
jgi:hypothetical protein